MRMIKNVAESFSLDIDSSKSFLNFKPISIVQKNAKNLKQLRKSKGFTLYDLALLTGLSVSYLSRLESSDRRLNTEILSKLALALGCNEDEFFKTNVERIESLDGFKKNLPVYRIISEGIDISDNPHSIIIFNAAMDYVFRTPKLSSSDTGFAIFAPNCENSPAYRLGDYLYFDEAKSFNLNDMIMVVDKNSFVFIGYLFSKVDNKIIIKTYSGKSYKFKNSEIGSIFKMVAVDYS